MNYTLMYQALKKVLEKDEQIDYAMSGKNAHRLSCGQKYMLAKLPGLIRI